ncbi:DUF5050 domain-containing protein [Lachnoanaerobaculum umeaense]|uniref:DUF5050 domain-containing protein n=1 Tax=Lachnoanaerobaculum umeaense TaxID=617123 RepID=A0A385Q0U7_9FIRM|nr:DUF5050 domain-containing protein [Lachnoanaerobaculum umeaense]AYA99970.1 DUF5050 domain-containing protein [Lachnoanaerobaculum umeaense]PZW94061.1 uncharacterized protein DUF5050 [Lachnoanaerobaculum umeaense]
MRVKKHAIFASFVLSASLLFTGCSVGLNTDSYKKSETEDYTKANKKNKKEKKKDKEDKKEVKELKNTAVNDGNLVGNMVCYGRMVNNGDVYYFRNPKDQERIYSVDMSGNVSRISGDIFMKDMHILNGNIYYANTTTGDQKDTNFTDRNLYRYSISTGENTRLTDLGFGTGDDSWLSFESLVDNYCYFSYSNGQDGIYHICRVNTDGQDFTELFTIPAGQNVGNPNVSVVDKRYVYFLTKDGFNYYDMETKQNTVAIPGFDCQNYIIYDGTLYYTEEDPYLRSSDLTGGNQKIVYDGSGLGFAADSVQFNIYENTLYVLEKSYEQKMGSLKKMNMDGSNVVDIAEDIKWFNIVNGNVFLRYWDGKSKPDTELYTYNIAANTPIGQMVNFDAAVANAKPEVATKNTQPSSSEKDDSYYMEKYEPVIFDYYKYIYEGFYGSTYIESGSYGPNEEYRFGFSDINGNGSKEMIVSHNEFITAIYALNNGVPVIVDAGGPKTLIDIFKDGEIHVTHGFGNGYEEVVFKLDNNDKIVVLYSNEIYGEVYKINGSEVTESEYNRIMQKYLNGSNDNKYYIGDKSFYRHSE